MYFFQYKSKCCGGVVWGMAFYMCVTCLKPCEIEPDLDYLRKQRMKKILDKRPVVVLGHKKHIGTTYRNVLTGGGQFSEKNFNACRCMINRWISS